MTRAITWRWTGKRADGRRCTITEVTEYEPAGWPNLEQRGSYVLVDQESTERLSKGRYRLLSRDEIVVCDAEDAP